MGLHLQLIFCKLMSCHQFSDINLLYELFCCQLLRIIFLKLLLRVSKKIICVIWRSFTEWHTTFSSLQNMESMLISFMIRRSYSIIPVIWQQPNPRKALARPISDLGPQKNPKQPIKRLGPQF